MREFKYLLPMNMAFWDALSLDFAAMRSQFFIILQIYLRELLELSHVRQLQEASLALRAVIPGVRGRQIRLVNIMVCSL